MQRQRFGIFLVVCLGIITALSSCATTTLTPDKRTITSEIDIYNSEEQLIIKAFTLAGENQHNVCLAMEKLKQSGIAVELESIFDYIIRNDRPTIDWDKQDKWTRDFYNLLMKGNFFETVRYNYLILKKMNQKGR
jgi:hypothetical protein